VYFKESWFGHYDRGDAHLERKRLD